MIVEAQKIRFLRRFSALLVCALFISACTAQAQSIYQVIKAFGFGGESSSRPTGGIIEGTDGLLYGTTDDGGSNNLGTIYKITKAGNDFTLLKSFDGVDGAHPIAELLQASDSLFYGTSAGYSTNRGTVFRITTNGTHEVLKFFSGADGNYPRAGLLEGTDGFLYGTTVYGGISNRGTVFRLSKEGSSYSVIKDFFGLDGANPWGRLAQDGNGALYGTTSRGGSSNYGTVFRLDPNGSDYSVLKNFQGTNDGAYPYGGVVLGSEGVLLGTTMQGGDLGRGTLYKLNPNGTGHVILKSFGGSSSDNGFPHGSPTLIGNVIYGTTSSGGLGFGSVYSVDQVGNNYTVLKIFTANGDAVGPRGALHFGSDGFVYGTTASGGLATAGTIFRLKTDGADYSVLKSFVAGGNDGTYPRATLLQGSDGMLYGTTWSGGSNDAGIVFKVHASGSGYTILKSFAPADGLSPYGALMQSQEGVLFGTTLQGGTNQRGSIFRLSTDGTGFAVVKNFNASADGYSPFAGLMQANDGKLYGTTLNGGYGGGVIFRLNSDGSNFTVLKRLNDVTRTDGAYSYATLIQGLDGALYGTTAQGGTHFAGTVFKINLNGSNYTVLRSFTGTNGDGSILHGGMLQTSNGVLYGVTDSGGISNRGTIFRINADGTDYQILRRFSGIGGDGRNPFGGLVQRANGLIYGVTAGGGAAGQGTVFQLKPDGTGYAVLHSLNAGGSVQGLLQTPDGKLYGGTWGGGPMSYGTLFSLEPCAVVLPLVFLPQGVEVPITGIPERNYVLQRSASIVGPWTNIANVTAGQSGSATVVDVNPYSTSAFYRTTDP